MLPAMIPRSIIHDVTYGMSTPITTSQAVNIGVRMAGVRKLPTCRSNFFINSVSLFLLYDCKDMKKMDTF